MALMITRSALAGQRLWSLLYGVNRTARNPQHHARILGVAPNPVALPCGPWPKRGRLRRSRAKRGPAREAILARLRVDGADRRACHVGQRRACYRELPRITLPETVWKIAEGLSSVLRRRQKAVDRGSFDPYRPPSGPLFSETSRFSKQFSTRSGEQGFPSVRWTTLGGIMSIRGKDGA